MHNINSIALTVQHNIPNCSIIRPLSSPIMNDCYESDDVICFPLLNECNQSFVAISSRRNSVIASDHAARILLFGA